MLRKKLAKTLTATKGLSLLYSTLLAFWMGDVVASTGQSLSDVIGTVQGNVSTLGPFLTIVAYIAGVAFAIIGIVKFKAHKDNPTQIALSIPIVYLLVGAGLLFLPSIMGSAGSTVFGSGQAVSGRTGSNLP